MFLYLALVGHFNYVCLFVCVFQHHTSKRARAATPNLTNAHW